MRASTWHEHSRPKNFRTACGVPSKGGAQSRHPQGLAEVHACPSRLVCGYGCAAGAHHHSEGCRPDSTRGCTSASANLTTSWLPLMVAPLRAWMAEAACREAGGQGRGGGKAAVRWSGRGPGGPGGAGVPWGDPMIGSMVGWRFNSSRPVACQAGCRLETSRPPGPAVRGAAAPSPNLPAPRQGPAEW